MMHKAYKPEILKQIAIYLQSGLIKCIGISVSVLSPIPYLFSADTRKKYLLPSASRDTLREKIKKLTYINN